MKPMLYGYQVVEAGTPPEVVMAGQVRLRRFAVRRGFAVGPVFVQRCTDPPGAALAAVVRAAKGSPLAVVGVVTWGDLGRSSAARWRTRFLLVRVVRVLVAERRS